MKFDMKTAPLRSEALQMMLDHWKPEAAAEYVELGKALGRIAAENIYSQNTLPVYRVSSFDGFAVKSKAFRDGMPDTSGWVYGREYAPADTGDDFPDEYDAVIAVEDVTIDESGFRIQEDLRVNAGDNVRPAGSTIREGDLLAEAHRPITGPILSLLASGGIRMVPVVKKPLIGFIPTGSELIPTGCPPERGQNVETNGLMFSARAEELGCDFVCFPIIRDDREMLGRVLDEALAVCDIVIINGGSSRGGEDYNAELLKERAEFFHHGVRAVPGRPVGISVIRGKAALNFPGPPLAAWLAADWLLGGMVAAYYKLPAGKRPTVKAVLAKDLTKPSFAERLCTFHLERNENGFTANEIPRNAGNLTLRLMNGFYAAPVGTGRIPAGTEIEVELLTGEEYI